MRDLRSALVMFAIFTLLTGLVYPAAVYVVAQLAFPAQANGSVIAKADQIIGSSLIGQSFTDPKYFQPRPSAADYDASASGGSNLGPNHPALATAIAERIAKLGGRAPLDLLTASGSGLDPHISPEAAEHQAERIATARGRAVSEVRALIAAHREDRFLGIFGEPRVNVLELNLALDGF